MTRCDSCGTEIPIGQFVYQFCIQCAGDVDVFVAPQTTDYEALSAPPDPGEET